MLFVFIKLLFDFLVLLEFLRVLWMKYIVIFLIRYICLNCEIFLIVLDGCRIWWSRLLILMCLIVMSILLNWIMIRVCVLFVRSWINWIVILRLNFMRLWGILVRRLIRRFFWRWIIRCMVCVCVLFVKRLVVFVIS